MAEAGGPGYSDHLQDWLRSNWTTWERFCAAARKVAERGHTRYSAYVIVNVLRWRADIEGVRFSMTNTLIPDLARLYNATCGAELFSTSTRFARSLQGSQR